MMIKFALVALAAAAAVCSASVLLHPKDDDGDCVQTIEQINTTCPDVGQEFYQDTEHCSQYWECFDGCAYHRLCQLDYLFDPVHEWCDFPDRVDCGDRDCDGRPCKEPLPPTDFDCPASNGYFPDPENCMKYYHCFDDAAERLSCEVQDGQQLLYDPDHEWCNWPDDVDCGDRPVCDANDDNCSAQPTAAPDNCSVFGSCSDNGSFRPEGDCQQCFCECSNGRYLEVCCQPELVFNAQNGQCDWPYNIPQC